MSMISELVDRLRIESKSMGKYGVDYMATLLMEASDTIIMLSEKARADRLKGKWEWISSTFDRVPCECRYRCSSCHHETITHGGEPWEKFCPYCGADMKGEEDD